VEVEDLAKHKMDSEYFEIDEEAAQIINKALDAGRRVCAVGTTVVRALESSVSANDRVVPDQTWTHKFIYPPYRFKIPNAMITNFHLPKSTLLMLVSAFAGYDLIMRAYKEAVKEKYRFFSYGDAMLIL
jgi:S-adenosylmethionine:tRNA ribosyltransferase-isomerase